MNIKIRFCFIMKIFLILIVAFISQIHIVSAEEASGKVVNVETADSVLYNGDSIDVKVKAEVNYEEIKKIILTYECIGKSDTFSVECNYNDDNLYTGKIDVTDAIIAGDYNLKSVNVDTIEGKELEIASYASATLSKMALTHVDSIKIIQDNFTMENNTKKFLTVDILPTNQISQEILWNSSNKNVATIDATGLLVAKGVGETTITSSVRSDDGMTKNYSIKVKVKYAKLKSASIKNKALIIKLGQKGKCGLKLNPTYADIKEMKWTSSNKKVASVSKDGYIRGLKKGNAEIKGVVTPYVGKKYTFKIKVNIVDPIIIVLDPGHGKQDSGAVGHGLKERNVNLEIAKACRTELNKYKGVTVYLTRDSDSKFRSLEERAKYAKSVKADMLISLHINAGGKSAKGAEVYVTRKKTSSKYYSQMSGLARNVLNELSKVGIGNRGIKTRKHPDKSADYYGVIRYSVERGIPAMIIEHCFISSSDYKFINSASKNKKLGIADAKAIVKYYDLKKK